MMRRAYLYDSSTGLFSGKTFEYFGPDFEAAVRANTPVGSEWVEGDFDPLTKRIDLQSGELVDYQSAQPDDDHEWNADIGRWVKRAAVLQWEQDRLEAMSRLKLLDLRRSRALEDHALSPDERTGVDQKLPRERLEALRSEAEQLRQIVNRSKPSAA